jgi:hypothetical protein
MIAVDALDVLIAWACLAAISVVTDMTFVFRSLSGRDGADALALIRAHAARAGGVRKWIMTSLALDIFMPWLMWQGLVAALRDKLR